MGQIQKFCQPILFCLAIGLAPQSTANTAIVMILMSLWLLLLMIWVSGILPKCVSKEAHNVSIVRLQGISLNFPILLFP